MVCGRVVNEELAVAYCKKANKILRSYKAHKKCPYSVINNKEMFKKMSELDPQFQIDEDGVKYVTVVSVETF